MPNYQEGKLYEVFSTADERVYRGSTTQPLEERWRGHLTGMNAHPNRSLYAAMRANPDSYCIRLLHLFPCSSKLELEQEEYRVVAEVPAALSLNVLRKRDMAALRRQARARAFPSQWRRCDTVSA